MDFLFFIKKLITLLLLPLGFSSIIIIFSLLLKRKDFSIFGILTLIFFSNNLTNQILWRYLEYPYQRLNEKTVPQGDYIVVLSSSRYKPPGKGNIYEWHDPDRFLAGINLFKSQKGTKLYFTGGANPYKSHLPPEGKIYKEEAIALGVPENVVFTTKKVYNTHQEAKAISNMLEERSFPKPTIILVTSAYHMKRAKKLFEREGIKVQEFPVDFKTNKINANNLLNPINFIPNASSLSSSSQAIRELYGRLFYRIN